TANNRGIAAKATKPVAMTENGHRSRVRLVIGVADCASDRRIHAQSVVISAGNELPGDDLRLLARQRVQLRGRHKSEDLRESPGLRAELLIGQVGKRAAYELPIVLAPHKSVDHPHRSIRPGAPTEERQLLRLLDREFLQQYCIRHAEERRI